ncbi:MAG: hypothetical protein JO306_03720 [Gemmatimonadetes bacterium]|nr:hypothetical protein [Gemmatimonadota bacterium]
MAKSTEERARPKATGHGHGQDIAPEAGTLLRDGNVADCLAAEAVRASLQPLTEKERAELSREQTKFYEIQARIEYSLQRAEDRLAAMLRGENLPWDPMELTKAEWEDVCLQINAWEMTLNGRSH